MSLQTSALTLTALGIAEDPTLRRGVHLRWFVDPMRGFPPLGFDIFRRRHRVGTPQVLNFSTEIPRTLSRPEFLGTTQWQTEDFAPVFETAQSASGPVTVLRPVRSALTCRFDPTGGLVRRVELDIVHWAATRVSDSPVPLTIWGTSGSKRVASGAIKLTFQNHLQAITVAVASDALDGFQLWAGRYGILRVRWTLVNDEAELGWTRINKQRIGFPLTAPNYQVSHAYSPDAGQGQQDWQEASDRLRAGQPTGAGGSLSPQLAQRFGLPAFTDFRTMMRDALSASVITSQPATGADPHLSLGAIELTLFEAIDPDIARMLGLAMIDTTAVPAERYDYKAVAYWPGRLRWEWVCTDGGGGTTTVPVTPGGSAGTEVIVTTVRAGGRRIVRARLPGWLTVPHGVNLATIPGLAVQDSDGSSAASSDRASRGTEVSTSGRFGTVEARESVILRFPKPTSRAEITVRSDGPEPLAIIIVAGETLVRVQMAPGNQAIDVDVSVPGATAIIVTGRKPAVTRTCRLTPTNAPTTEEWITFDVQLGPVAPLPPPGPLAGRMMPGIARGGTGEQVVGLILEPPPPPRYAFDLFPIAKLPRDAVVYEFERRADGDAPLADADSGVWSAIRVGLSTGPPRLSATSHSRTPTHRALHGWQIEPQDFIDGTIDPDIRYFSYRARGHDIFGRTSGWSQHVTVDAADRTGPPAPDRVEARWLDGGHPWVNADDTAFLNALGIAEGVRVRWSWSPVRQQQAPDTSHFRVYWNARPFTTLQGAVIAVQNSGDAYLVTVQLPQSGAPPVDAFADDWLRQGTHQYFVRASSSASPCVLTVSGAGMPLPTTGTCTLSLRDPDPQRLDLLGNPLRHDASTPTTWDRRYAEGPVIRHTGAVGQTSAGVAVSLQQVQADTPRAGVSTVTLAPEWRWSVINITSLELHVGTVNYPVLGGTLGIAATVLVDTSAQVAPPVGPATMYDTAGQLGTIELPSPATASTPFSLVGGTLEAGQLPLGVRAHRIAGSTLKLVVDTLLATGTQVTWYPDYEFGITAPALAISPATPRAIGVVGVSAVDGRQYAPDQRQVAGEPTSPGNEGPIVSTSVERRYRGAPAASPAPIGAGQHAELWAPEPDPFSRNSRFLLRWMPTAGASGYLVHYASLDAVLDSDAGDRAVPRGAYAGMQPLSGTALDQWRLQQSQLGPQALQALATAQSNAFVQLSPQPLAAIDPLLVDSTAPGELRFIVPLDGNAPGRHFLRIQSIDQAGNRGPMGSATLPIVVPDTQRPAPPLLRPVTERDRTLWVVWDAPDPALNFKVYRAQLAAGSIPDVRDMTFVTAVRIATAPEPTAVHGGEARLPGAIPHSLVAAYRAENYDPTLAPDAQISAPIGGTLAVNGRILTGLTTVPDGSPIFAVVRYTSAGQSTLVQPAASCAYRDTSITPEVPYQYRVVAERQTIVAPQKIKPVESVSSSVSEGVAPDARRPVPPAAMAVWDAVQRLVKVTWASGGLPADLELKLQRTVDGDDYWERIDGWVPASVGNIDDMRVAPGTTYHYRLLARNAAGRTSTNEPKIGPVVVP